MTNATTRPSTPPPKRMSNATATAMTRPTKNSRISSVRRLLREICSYTEEGGPGGRGLELHLHRRGVLRCGVEEVACLEVEHAGEDHRRELLDAGVVGPDAVVVELP